MVVGSGSNGVAYDVDVVLGAVALIALVIGVLGLVAWIVAPRAGATRNVTRGLLRLWVVAMAAAALSGLLAFVIGRDTLDLF